MQAPRPEPSADAEPPPSSAAAPTWRRNPWWIPPFLGSVPDLEPHLLRALALVALGMFFEAYDLSLLTAALKHIAEDLRIPPGDLGWILGAVRWGGVVAFFLVPFADRLGRRRVFLVALVGMSIGTLATAFAQSPLQFLVLQLGTRACMLTVAAVAFVMLTEEFPARHRGWGIGMLGALAGFGHGLGALLFAAIDVLPFGWRALYAVGVVPLLFLPTFRRTIQETARFREHHARLDRTASAGVLADAVAPLVALARAYPGRALCVGLAGLLSSLGTISVFQFTSYFVQTVHEWAPWQYSAMFVGGGAVGIIGHVVAGRLGDRIGRRRVGFVGFALYPLGALAFYHGPGWSLPLSWAFFVFCGSAGDMVVRAFSTELFPTSHRGTSAGWLTLVQTFGWILGLWIVGGGAEDVRDLVRVTSALTAGVLVAGLCLLLLPETRLRELEAISEERDHT